MTSKISTLRSALLAATLAFAPLTASLHAQTAQRVQVNVPFDFQNGSKTFAAGVYTLTMQPNHVLLIQGRNDGGLVVARKEDGFANPSTTGKVVFHHVGSQYFLSEVWQQGESSHTVCTKTTAEIKAQKALQSLIAAGATAAPAVEIAAR